MEIVYRSTSSVELAGVRIDRIVQEPSGSYLRTHEIDDVRLVYFLPTGDIPALGCLEEPVSHRSFHPLGSTMALPPNHRFHVFSGPSTGREMIVMRYSEPTWRKIDGIAELFSDTRLGRWSDIRAPELLRTLDRVALELQRCDQAQPTILAGLAFVALGELMRYLGEDCGDGNGQLSSWQARRIAARLAEPGPPPSVADLAAICGISRRHLMRLFKGTTGETVMNCIERVRFAHARELLVTGAPIKKIAAELGFASQGSFSTAFRRYVGVGPAEYRKRYLTHSH